MVVVALIACQGCTGSEAAKEIKLRNDLKTLGLAYISYHDENQKGPASWEELIAYATKANLFPVAIQRVRDAGYEVTWNVKLSDVQGGTSNTVLAKPPGEGPKLMMDGSVP